MNRLLKFITYHLEFAKLCLTAIRKSRWQSIYIMLNSMGERSKESLPKIKVALGEYKILKNTATIGSLFSILAFSFLKWHLNFCSFKFKVYFIKI